MQIYLFLVHATMQANFILNRPFARSGHVVRIMLGRKLRSWTFKIKESRAGLVRVPLF